MSDWLAGKDELAYERYKLYLEKDGIRFVNKADSRFWRFLGFLSKWLTLGAMGDKFMTEGTTTIGNTIALPSGWLRMPSWARLTILHHERVHVEHYRKYSVPVMLFLYCLFPLPIGLSYFRYRFEREAYLAGALFLMSESELPLEDFMVSKIQLVENLAQCLSGPEYFWAWPFKGSIRLWFFSRLPLLPPKFLQP